MNVFVIHSGSDSEVVDDFIDKLTKFDKKDENINKTANISKSADVDETANINKKADIVETLNILKLDGSKKIWKPEALSKIKQANVVLFIVGENSLESKNIGWEITQSIKLNKFLIYYKIDENYKEHKALYGKNRFSGQLSNKPQAKEIKDIGEFFKCIDEHKEKINKVLNEDIEGNSEREGLLMEQYKIFLETSESLVSRRQELNNFYTGINTAILAAEGAVIAFFKDDVRGGMIIVLFMSIAGLVLDISWIGLLDSYGMLNASKMKILGIIEKKLPSSLFEAEWAIMSDKLNNKKYVSFTQNEKMIPKIFSAIYSAIIIMALVFIVFLFFLN